MTTDFVCMFPVWLDDNGTLFFEEDEGLESDSWYVDGKQESQILRNKENQVLIALVEDQTQNNGVFEHMTDFSIGNAQGIRFNIHLYKDTSPTQPPVAFSTTLNNKTYHMSVERADGEMRVRFKEGNVPEAIVGHTSDVIFYKTLFTGGSKKYFKFETALEKRHFLAFQKVHVRGRYENRLIIKPAESRDRVDETIRFTHSS